MDISAAVSDWDGVPVTVTSDAKGHFIFPGLPAGAYRLTTLREGYVSVRPEGRKSPLDAGVWITTRPGQPLKDVVLRISRAGAISGRVFDTHGQPVVNADAFLVRQSYDDHGRQITQPQYLGRDLDGGRTNDRGEFRIFGIPAGEYRVGISPDLSETAFQPNAGNEIEHVHDFFSPQSSEVAADGTFTIDAAEGRYSIAVLNLPKDVFLESIRYGSQEATDSGPTLERSSNAQLELTLSGATGTVAGFVRTVTGEPLPHSIVTLIPGSDRRQNFRAFRTGETDDSGAFRIEGVPAGEYSALALKGIEPGADTNRSFVERFENLAQRITAEPGKSKTLDLRIVPTRN